MGLVWGLYEACKVLSPVCDTELDLNKCCFLLLLRPVWLLPYYNLIMSLSPQLDLGLWTSHVLLTTS